ncbi:STE3-domain-containing protein [Rickenella mellea]|uniref:STE3-domain-containing protein n=1 Tax=Rickenella mellea TaxID=50990 RepID=A0A4Y7PYE5_9AGAM|nr:STE3-domain-containing protein [Rickenella mellea]
MRSTKHQYGATSVCLLAPHFRFPSGANFGLPPAGRILVGYGIAIPACGLCIQRRLYLVTSTQIVTVGDKEKIRYFIQDLFVTLGFPLLSMALVYIVQDNRYTFYEDFGCTVPIYNVWPSYPVYTVWPLAIASVSLCYSLLTLRAFAARRSELNEFLHSGTVTFKRHVRLMCLASMDIAFTVPLSVWSLVDNIRNMDPYVSWGDTHLDFSVIRTYPAIIWRSSAALHFIVEFHRWSVILCAVVFVAFFTFAEESLVPYGAVFCAGTKRFNTWNQRGSSTHNGGPSSGHFGDWNGTASTGGLGTVLPVFFSANNHNSVLTPAIKLENHAGIDDSIHRKNSASGAPESLGSSRTSVTTASVLDGQR